MVHAGNEDIENQSRKKGDVQGAPSSSQHTPTLFGAEVYQGHDEDEPEKSVYEKNRALFLVQSCLLGVSYSLIWPTLWKLVTKEFNTVQTPWLYLLYGTTFVAYPLASMLTIPIIQKISVMNIRMMFLLLNTTQIVGNLMYAVNLHPVCLVAGRFIAGIGDAYFVVIMADARIIRNYKGGSLAAQCLAAFIFGLLLAQILNIICIYIPFNVGDWSLTVLNLPSILAAILFSVFAFTLLLLFDIKGSKKRTNSYHKDPTQTTDPEHSAESNEGPRFVSMFVCFFSFVHTFVTSMLEILIPIFIYQRLNESVLLAVLIYIFLAITYVMILIFTASINSPLMLEVSLVISVVLKMIALFCIILLTSKELGYTGAVLSLVGMMICVAFAWSNEDIMYTNLILTLVAYRHREAVNSKRQMTSKVSFVLAVLVPFLFNHSSILYVSVALIVIVLLLFGFFIILRMFGRTVQDD